MSEDETPTAYYITPEGEKYAVTNPSHINSLNAFIKTDDRATFVGRVNVRNIIPTCCSGCGSSQIAIGTISGQRYWTCSACGINGDL